MSPDSKRTFAAVRNIRIATALGIIAVCALFFIGFAAGADRQAAATSYRLLCCPVTAVILAGSLVGLGELFRNRFPSAVSAVTIHAVAMFLLIVCGICL